MPSSKKHLDYIYRRPVRAMMPYYSSKHVSDYALTHTTGSPDWFVENGIAHFPAGAEERYVVNGKDYNYDGTLTLQEQRESLERDLAAEGLEPDEISEFITTLPTKEGGTRLLSFDESGRWLALFPQYRSEALERFKAAEREVLASDGHKGQKRR